MAQTTAKGPVIQVKPQPNVYTIMLIVAVLALGMTVGFVLYNLLTPVADGGYGLKFEEIFKPLLPIDIK